VQSWCKRRGMHNLSEQTAIILKNICIKITYY
jgi:hypothetical protein